MEFELNLHHLFQSLLSIALMRQVQLDQMML
jgi:hypothetical protein